MDILGQMNVIKIALITISLGLSSNSFAKEFEAELVALDSVKGTFSNSLNKAMAWSFCTSLINEV